ncbi:hypothetical protein AALO_G00115240 [Alosa alosa]|uniref:Uncharacterized protein n=1 Tax=Alosa alosa TaxID=278164 RepID=A0AAV6GUI4_9TELE|nr:hypothetical protein AALO_G00115240 [Alosa alosa]
MEGNHTVLHLYEPIRERTWVSQCPPTRKGQSSSQRVIPSQKDQRVICQNLKKGESERGSQNGPTEEVLSSCENSKEAGTVVEVPWLANLLALCADCQDPVAMGNHHGAKHLHSPEEDWETGRQQPQREGLGCGSCSGGDGSPQLTHSLSNSAAVTFSADVVSSPRTWAQGRRLKKLWAMNSVHVEETLQSLVKQRLDPAAEFCTGGPLLDPAAEFCTCGPLLDPAAEFCAGGPLRDTAAEEEEYNCPEIPGMSSGMGKDLNSTAENAEPNLTDGQPALDNWSALEDEPIAEASKLCLRRKDSDYDNELYLCLLDNVFDTTPSPAEQEMHPVPHAAETVTQAEEWMRVERSLSPPTQFQVNEAELKDAVLRVAAKMEEVESIIQRRCAEASDTSKEDPAVRVQELRALGEELNRSLRRALQLDGLLLGDGSDNEDDWGGVSGIRPLLEEQDREAVWDLDESGEEKFPDPEVRLFQHDCHRQGHQWRPRNASTASRAGGVSGAGGLGLGRKSASSPSLSSLVFASSPNAVGTPGSLSPLLSPCSSRLSSPVPLHQLLLLPRGTQREDEGQRKHAMAGVANSTRATESEDEQHTPSRSALALEFNNTNQRAPRWFVPGKPAFPPMPTEETLLNQEDDWHLDLDFSLSFCKSVAQASSLNHADFLRITPPEHDIISDAPFSPELVFVVSI